MYIQAVAEATEEEATVEEATGVEGTVGLRHQLKPQNQNKKFA